MAGYAAVKASDKRGQVAGWCTTFSFCHGTCLFFLQGTRWMGITNHSSVTMVPSN
jgi:hypothetical protein